MNFTVKRQGLSAILLFYQTFSLHFRDFVRSKSIIYLLIIPLTKIEPIRQREFNFNFNFNSVKRSVDEQILF